MQCTSLLPAIWHSGQLLQLLALLDTAWQAIAKYPGHAPIAGEVFSATAYEKPLSRCENTKIVLVVCACPV